MSVGAAPTRQRLDPPATTVVTGATGWLGTALVSTLLGDGPHARAGAVRALVRPGEAVDRLPATVEVVRGDVTDPASLDALFTGAAGPIDVIHAAGVIHPGSVAEFEAVNHLGTLEVMGACRRHGARRVVHVSSNSPFGTNAARDDRFVNDEPYRPALGYGTSKMRGELAVFDAVDAGLDAVVVRPPWFYGPHQPARQTTFFTLVRRGRFPIVGDGGQVRSMTYVDDLVQGIVLAELVVTPPGSAWWIADARPYTVVEIVETVGGALRAEGYEVSPNRFRLPAVAGIVAERLDAAVQRTGRYVTGLHVLGEMGATIAVDVSAARRDLGHEPRVGLAEGMRRSIRWCRDQGIEL
ncbi:NAD-dependent epimerase/dehydratase family protein [Ilumatobacter sp.]|uniref:NAD-dependent epimerase/dehydratase family protein n=1 Tax=Ilumatobacter sp. TaxID=1967498 RepID=UPI003B51D5C1